MSATFHASPKGLYEFGAFRLDCAKHLLLKDNKALPLSPKAFEILVLLVERRGGLITKSEILQAVWPDTFVEENNLTQYVSVLRKALGDGVDDHEYIQTVPKLGYRFVSEVREIGQGERELLVSKRRHTRIVLREEEKEAEDYAETRGEFASATAPIDVVKVPATASAARTWMLAVVAVLAAGALALIVVAIRPRHSADAVPGAASGAAPAPIRPRHSLVVLGFKNLSGRVQDEWLSDALSEMLTTELSAGGQLRVVSSENTHRIRSNMKLEEETDIDKPILLQIRNRSGADLAVSGSFVEVGSEPATQIRLDLRLNDTSTGENVFSTAVSGGTRELFALVSRSGAELRSRLGVAMLSDQEGAEDQAALPATPEAARLYSEGLARLRVFDALAAQKLLAKAVSADPKFAPGHSALASAWSALGYDEKAKAEARRALDLSANLSREQHLVIAGRYAELTRDWDTAVATYQELFGQFPDNADYGLRLASAQTSAGKGNDALSTLGKLRKLQVPASQGPQLDLAEATAAESLGDFKQENDAAERAIQAGEVLGERMLVARAWTSKSWAMRRTGRPREAADGLAEAKRIFAEAGDTQGVGSTLHLIAGMQSEQGDFAQAARSYQEAITLFRQIGDRRSLAMSLNGLATVQYERGDLADARKLYEQYFDIEREVGSKINAAGALGNIANIADAQGDLAEAKRLNEESLNIFTKVGDQRATGTALGNLAILLFEQGDLEGARKRFDEALEIKRKIGYQRGIAYDLSGLSEVFRAEDNLSAAQQRQEESLSIRNQIGEKHNAAVSRLYLAIIALESQRAAEAEGIASETARQFHEERATTDEAAAEEVLARSLLAQGKIPEARSAIARASSLARGTSNLPLSFDIAATAARIGMAIKNPVGASTAANARKNLESSLSVAQKCGYLEYEYKLGLAIGEAELESGDADSGRERLAALANDAQAKGFGLVARRAAAALKTQPERQD